MDINKQIAIKGAELLGLEIDNMHENMVDVFVIWPDETMPRDFDPVYSGTDMNKLIEALKITVQYRSGMPNGYVWGANTPSGTIWSSKSRDEAIRQCVIKALGLHNDSEALGVDND